MLTESPEELLATLRARHLRDRAEQLPRRRPSTCGRRRGFTALAGRPSHPDRAIGGYNLCYLASGGDARRDQARRAQRAVVAFFFFFFFRGRSAPVEYSATRAKWTASTPGRLRSRRKPATSTRASRADRGANGFAVRRNGGDARGPQRREPDSVAPRPREEGGPVRGRSADSDAAGKALARRREPKRSR